MDPERDLPHPARGLTRRNLFLRSGQALFAAAGAATLASRSIAQSPSAAPSGRPAPEGLTVRPDAKTLSATQKRDFVNAILGLKIKPSPWFDGISTYDSFVLVHRDALGCGLSAAHMGSAFLPWHRQFLLLFEEQLRTIEPDVVVPYWDWTVDNGPDSYLWKPDLMGGNGVKDQGEAVLDGPFAKDKWPISVFDYSDEARIPYITRDFGAASIAPDLPTAQDVEDALAIGTYDVAPWDATVIAGSSFRNALEGWRDCVQQLCGTVDGVMTRCSVHAPRLHNRVHLWVSGEFAFAHELRMDEPAPGASPAPGHSMAPADTEDVFGTMAANSSPNDPVFWLHHANVDRLWSIWTRRWGQLYEPQADGPVGHNIDDAMWPYIQWGLTITPRMMLDTRALGYVYDTDLA